MAIIGPKDLPLVLRVDSTEMKSYVVSKMGGSSVELELSEKDFETALRVTGDFIAGYFPLEQRMAMFMTEPLRATYPMPEDAYWIQEVNWDGGTSSFHDIFSADYYIVNTGVFNQAQTYLLDYHLLQAYKKSAQKILGSEGHWDVINEVDGDATQQLIRLYPTPKGSFPVAVLYIPVVRHFRSPQAKMLACDMLLSEVKEMVGMARRKIQGFPAPGGTISLDGDQLISEAKELRQKVHEQAILLGEPMPIGVW